MQVTVHTSEKPNKFTLPYKFGMKSSFKSVGNDTRIDAILKFLPDVEESASFRTAQPFMSISCVIISAKGSKI